MKHNTFRIDEYLSRFKKVAQYQLHAAMVDEVTLQDILSLATPAERETWDQLPLSYTDSAGSLPLREEIVRHFYSGMSPEQVFCFAGADEGIYVTFQALCQPGNHLVISTPCYQPLYDIPEACGATLTKVPLREEESWKLNIDALAAAITAKTVGIIINFPHNPTGQVMTSSDLEALISLCRKHDVWLFSDEVYRLLGAPASSWAPAAAQKYEKAISLGVMSKIFGMSGVRVGWMATQNRTLIETVRNIKQYTSVCNAAPSEWLSVIALRNTDQLLARNNKIIAQNKQMVAAFVQRHSDLFSWIEPQAGCVGFIKYHGSQSVAAFCEQLVIKKGVQLVPASIFDDESNHFRIGFGRTDTAEMLLLLEAFITGN